MHRSLSGLSSSLWCNHLCLSHIYTLLLIETIGDNFCHLICGERNSQNHHYYRNWQEQNRRSPPKILLDVRQPLQFSPYLSLDLRLWYQNLGNTLIDTNLTILNDLDVPIAFWNGVRLCTTHPIADFVSSERLSPQFRAFTTNLSKGDIPKDVHEALQELNWKTASHDEIKALRKNGT